MIHSVYTLMCFLGCFYFCVCVCVCVQVPVSSSGSRATSRTWCRGNIPSSETRSLGESCSSWSLFLSVYYYFYGVIITPAGMCTIKVAWQPPMTSASPCLPPFCLSCRPSTRHTSSSPTASGKRRSVRSDRGGSSRRHNDAFSRIEMSSKASPEAACQLDSRYWKITTSDGNVEEVQGPGVVGTLLWSRDLP